MANTQNAVNPIAMVRTFLSAYWVRAAVVATDGPDSVYQFLEDTQSSMELESHHSRNGYSRAPVGLQAREVTTPPR